MAFFDSPEPEEIQAIRDLSDLKKWEMNQSARDSIRAYEAVQHISIRRQLHASLGVAAMSGKQRQS